MATCCCWWILLLLPFPFPVTSTTLAHGAHSISNKISASKRFKSIISFGDSLADTGNLVNLNPDNNFPFSFCPYGESFFHYPTGRCSDGRLVIDFIAEKLGLSLVKPYFPKGNGDIKEFREGVNFAVTGATVIDNSFFTKRGILNPFTNVSLGTQIQWFKEMLESSPSESSDFIHTSLILMGEIGGNDYNNPLIQHKSFVEIKSFVPQVVRTIGSAIKELIKLGGVTIVVPGNFPIGCLSLYLTIFESGNKTDYDSNGCLEWLNKFSRHHNRILQNELSKIREFYPHATVIYADYYNAAMQFYSSPSKFGFKSVLVACCGGGGPYNFNLSAGCGMEEATICDDPSLYTSWDGLHLTEAAYKIIADALIHGPVSNPPITSLSSLPSQIM